MPSPRTVRYLGLAGSGFMAVSAALGGSDEFRDGNFKLFPFLRGDYGVVLTLSWVIGTVLMIAAWWIGRRVVPSTRWALVTAGLWALPLLPFLPLGSEDVYSYACQGWVQATGGDPYATSPLQYGCPWLPSVSETWRDSSAPYGPLFLLLSAVAVEVGGESLTIVAASLRVIAVAGVALIAVGVPALARRAGAAPEKAAWTVLACPLILIHLISGMHNDALMTGLVVAGLAVAAYRTAGAERTAALLPLLLGGVLVGLAVGVKATAVVVLPFVVLLAVPSGTPLRALWRPGAVVLGGAVLALGGLSLISGRGLGWVHGLVRSGDTVEWTSPSTAIGLTVTRVAGLFGGQIDAVPGTRTIVTMLLAPVLVAIWWRARFGRPLFGAGLALGATVVFAPVFHPWYAIWPLAVLAATWPAGERPLRRWVLLPCAVAAALCLPDGYNIALGTKTQGALLMTAGVITVVVLAVRRVVAQRSERLGAAADIG